MWEVEPMLEAEPEPEPEPELVPEPHAVAEPTVDHALPPPTPPQVPSTVHPVLLSSMQRGSVSELQRSTFSSI